MSSGIVAPVVALVCWSLVIWLWMYATRIPAMLKAKVKLDPTIPPADLLSGLPAGVRWKADNYNHLMEQPTLFYAIALALALLDQGHGINAAIAWAYVGLRVLHSLIQTTVNVIILRFSVFVLSSLCLCALALHAAIAVF